MPKAVGLHDFTADDEGDLPFSVGEAIEVTDQTEPGEGWWTGRNSQGVVGIFPANHVELVDEGPVQATATHDFAAEDDGDLPLAAGDVFTVTSQVEPGEGWWTGENKGIVGIFPADHCELGMELLEPEPEPEPEHSKTPSPPLPGVVPQPEGDDDDGSDVSLDGEALDALLASSPLEQRTGQQ